MQLVNKIQASAVSLTTKPTFYLFSQGLGGTILQVPSAMLPPNFAAIVATFERVSASTFTCFSFLFVGRQLNGT